MKLKEVPVPIALLNSENGEFEIIEANNAFEYLFLNNNHKDSPNNFLSVFEEITGDKNFRKIENAILKSHETTKQVEIDQFTLLTEPEYKQIKMFVTPSQAETGEQRLTITCIDVSDQLTAGQPEIHKNGRQTDLQNLVKEKELAESIIDNLPTLFFLFNSEGQFYKWNPQLVIETGYADEEVEQMHTLHFFDEDQHENITNTIGRVLAEGSASVESELCTKSGKKIPYYFVGSKINYLGENCVVGYGINISERVEAENKLKVNEKRYKSLVQDGSDMIVIVDEEGNYKYVSSSVKRVLDYNANELMGKNAFSFIHPDDLARVQQTFRKLLDQRRITVEPYRFKDPTGEWRWIESTVTNLMDEPSVAGYVANSRDVTLNKNLKDRIIKEKNLLDEILRNIPMIFFIFDQDSNPLRWNKQLLEVTGYTEEEVKELTPIDYFRQEQIPEVLQTIERAFMEGLATIETEITTKSGETIPYYFFGARVKYEGQMCLAGYGIDISDRKRAEEELKKSEERFKNLVQGASDLIAIIDEKGNYKYVSPTSESVLSMPPSMFDGRNAFEFIHEDDIDRLVTILSILEPGEQHTPAPYKFKDGEGNWRWIETKVTNMTQEPSVGGYVANSRDISESKRQQAKLIKSLEEKKVLLSEIHHRVKNNMAIVSGLLQLQALNEDHELLTDKLNDSVSRIQAMASIHELLYQSDNFSELEFGQIIGKIVENTKETFSDNKEITVECDSESMNLNINQAIPGAIIINEVLTNSLKHAFKDRKQGKIQIKLSILGDNTIDLEICDDGIGLPSNFDEIRKNSLGMSIINQLVNQLSAEHKFESSKDGTCFTLRFKKLKVKGAASNLEL